MKRILLYMILMLNGILIAQDIDFKDLEIISNKMGEQELRWNEGDIPGFMKHYWTSDSLSFVGKNGLNKGWKKTLNSYLSNYDNKDKMGTLHFNNLSLNKIDVNTIYVVGSWKLIRKDELGDLEGYYSLIWQKKNGQWVIIADHSS